MSRFQFVADHQRRFGVKRRCTILNVARSSFYYWRRASAGQAADAGLAARIREVHQDTDGTYVVPRITAELRETGELVTHKRVACIMRQSGLARLRLRRNPRTTIADPAAAKATGPGGFTYLPLRASRRLADWAIADHMPAIDEMPNACHLWRHCRKRSVSTHLCMMVIYRPFIVPPQHAKALAGCPVAARVGVCGLALEVYSEPVAVV